ncbi:MAG: N-acetyltransferase [Aeromonadales bacterium]|nr:N-acetyltransferase [Aeromonadales bacterium]
MLKNIRLATQDDLEAINDIYNYEVLNGIATFDIHKRSLDSAREWFLSHNTTNHPIFVFLHKGEVVAYCSLSSYRDKEAFETTCEISLYVSKDHRSRGYGRILAAYTLSYALNCNLIHNVVAVITSTNLVSINLFLSLDFNDGGTIESCGLKCGKKLGITNLYKIVG